MTRLRIAVACLLAAGLLLVPASGSQAAGADGTMLERINSVRAKHGLRPLRGAPSLNDSARSYARRMMARDYFAHSSPIRASRRFRRLGEAIAYRSGKRARPRGTLRRWLRSPGHRSLILSSGFRYVGAGVTKGRFRGRKATIWVLHLGGRRRR